MKKRKSAAARKDSEVRVRVSEREKRLLMLAAEREGLSLSTWVRRLAVQSAQAH